MARPSDLPNHHDTLLPPPYSKGQGTRPSPGNFPTALYHYDASEYLRLCARSETPRPFSSTRLGLLPRRASAFFLDAPRPFFFLDAPRRDIWPHHSARLCISPRLSPRSSSGVLAVRCKRAIASACLEHVANLARVPARPGAISRDELESDPRWARSHGSPPGPADFGHRRQRDETRATQGGRPGVAGVSGKRPRARPPRAAVSYRAVFTLP
jgi:hypothetical protein